MPAIETVPWPSPRSTSGPLTISSLALFRDIIRAVSRSAVLHQCKKFCDTWTGRDCRPSRKSVLLPLVRSTSAQRWKIGDDRGLVTSSVTIPYLLRDRGARVIRLTQAICVSWQRVRDSNPCTSLERASVSRVRSVAIPLIYRSFEARSLSSSGTVVPEATSSAALRKRSEPITKLAPL
jgi:hypothetical protein